MIENLAVYSTYFGIKIKVEVLSFEITVVPRLNKFA
jgi:hypothetical protein